MTNETARDEDVVLDNLVHEGWHGSGNKPLNCPGCQAEPALGRIADRITDLEKAVRLKGDALRDAQQALYERADIIAQLTEERDERFLEAERWHGEVDRLQAALREYVEQHESHRPWCNGGYDDSPCHCDLALRIDRASTVPGLTTTPGEPHHAPVDRGTGFCLRCDKPIVRVDGRWWHDLAAAPTPGEDEL